MAAPNPYDLNEDGSAKDPAAFIEALKADPSKMEALEAEPEVAKVVLGGDLNEFQELLKSIYKASTSPRKQPAFYTMTARSVP
jgi:hypothetical protein